MAATGDFSTLRREGSRRWLEAREVLAVLQEPARYGLTVCRETPSVPATGSLFLFDRTLTKNFRRDGHIWRRKANGGVAETYEKLRVDGRERVLCSYARVDGMGSDHVELHRRVYALTAPGPDGEGGAHAGGGASMTNTLSLVWLT
ncbi:CG-1 domain-containing protein [Pavlovales sp. CCMP2436]|nr:CG-1 domain-containing protein [Pavlovales sp. CCMP2436]